MKFRIRHADMIVGILSLVALAVVVMAVVLIGSRQRWFSHDRQYQAWFDSAAGLSENMSIQYKGIPVGRVTSYRLLDDAGADRVNTRISIYEEYAYLIRLGTVIELRVSPIGLGNQFFLYPGVSGQPLLNEGLALPVLHSADADDLIARGISTVPASDEGINAIIASLQGVLKQLNETTVPGLNAVLVGADGGPGLVQTSEHIAGITSSLDAALAGSGSDGLALSVSSLLSSLQQTIQSLGMLLDTLSGEPGGLLRLVDRDGALYDQVIDALESANLILSDASRAASYVPGQMPQAAAMLSELRTALETAQDVLTSLTNNPLLRDGIPEKVNPNTAGTANRGGLSW